VTGSPGSSTKEERLGDLSGVRLLATDLDGTLIRTDHTVADETRTALRRATEAGLLVVFVTGRPPRWLDEITDVTDHTGIAVTANGAALYDLQSTTILHSFELSPAELVAITADIRAAYPDVQFGVEYGRNFGHEPDYAHDWQINPAQDRSGRQLSPPIVGGLPELLTQPATKLLARDRLANSDQFARDVEAMLAGRASVTHSSSNGLIEIGARGVTKASGLALVAREHGIGPAEVAAVGDMPNDLPMLAWAGHSFAVANAHPAVLAAAGTVLGTNDDHAVAMLVDAILAARRA
jgi:Cof subfamily protein (haloacid dehalogenase superfamily)